MGPNNDAETQMGTTMAWFSRKKRTAPQAQHPGDARLLDALSSGSDLSRPRDWIHFLYFADESSAQAAHAKASAAGWHSYGGVRQIEEGGEFSLSVRRDDLALSADVVAQARAFFTALAEEGGGDYDGWEAATDGASPGQADATASDTAASDTAAAGTSASGSAGSEPDQQKVEPLNDAERAWLERFWQAGANMGIDRSTEAVNEFFEVQRAQWFATPEAEREDPNTLINLIGAVAGRMIAEPNGLEWAVVADAYGTEMGIVSTDELQLVLFPMNAVGKRWAGENSSSVADYVLNANQHIDALRSGRNPGHD